MSRYTVIWLKVAESDLAQIWIDATNRKAVEEAANAIDHELANDAQRKGRPVSEGLYRLYKSPLHILFTVLVADCVVEVVSVRIERPRPETNGVSSTTK
jgi:plasmid stabilization system protein ParE